jgi:hypothetical protein
MKRSINLLKCWLVLLLITFCFADLSAQSKGIWTGPKVTFTKSDNADWTKAANQDRLNDTVWITRQNTQGIFNIKVNSSYRNSSSPVGTKWANGTTKNLKTLTFTDWENAVGNNPPGSINRDMVMMIERDSIYIDVKFKKWTQAGNGGGFSYERSSDCRSYKTVKIASCDSFVSPSKKYVWKKNGTYFDTLTNSLGCDSFLTYNLTIMGPDTLRKKFLSGCGEVILPFSKRSITTTGVYFDTLFNGTICGRDSILEATCIIYPVPTKNITVSACDSFISPSKNFVWKSSGVYKDNLPAGASCDTAVTVNLTIYTSNIAKISETACDSFISVSKRVYKQSGNYFDTIQTTHGCDSIVDLTLTINKSSLIQRSPTVCKVSYTSPSGKHVWGMSGTYYDTFTSSKGCDSILQINLTIDPLTSTSKISSCDPLVSPSKKYVYDKTGVYLDTLTTALLCDSIVTTDFTKLESTTSSKTVLAAINKYHSPSGKFVWTADGTYNDTIPNQSGCDSVMTFVMTFIDISLDVTQEVKKLTAVATGVNYQWLDCNNGFAELAGQTAQSFSPTAKGTYAVKLSNEYNSDTSACYDMTLNVDDVSNAYGITLYPNPNNGQFHLNLNQIYQRVEKIQIFNSNGQLIYENKEISAEMDLDALLGAAKGVYLIRISGKNVSYNSSIIIE